MPSYLGALVLSTCAGVLPPGNPLRRILGQYTKEQLENRFHGAKVNVAKRKLDGLDGQQLQQRAALVQQLMANSTRPDQAKKGRDRAMKSRAPMTPEQRETLSKAMLKKHTDKVGRVP